MHRWVIRGLVNWVVNLPAGCELKTQFQSCASAHWLSALKRNIPAMEQRLSSFPSSLSLVSSSPPSMRLCEQKKRDRINVVTVCPGGALGYIRALDPTQHNSHTKTSMWWDFCHTLQEIPPLCLQSHQFFVSMLSSTSCSISANASIHHSLVFLLPACPHCVAVLLPHHPQFLCAAPPPLPANTNGQRPSLALAGQDDLGFAIGIVTQVSPALTELNNSICAFLTLTGSCVWLSLGCNASAECKSWWPQ